MTTFQIVGLYVALYILLHVGLIVRVIRYRLGHRISMGDGGDAAMLARIRAHGNYTENAPFMMFGLLGMAMLNGMPLLIHLFGVAFLGARLFHMVGMIDDDSDRFRKLGTILSLLSLLGAAIYLLILIFLNGPV